MTSKRILITGGTGFLGSALVKSLQEHKHQLTILTRSRPLSQSRGNLDTQFIHHLDCLSKNEPFDVIINLAGHPIFEKRWSQVQKKKLTDSRIALTRSLYDYAISCSRPPELLISGSAIGIYGNRDNEILEDGSSAGMLSDFSSYLCQEWEASARDFEQIGTRVCLVRTGLVVDQDGGFLTRMLPLFKLGLGGRIGNGNQWMSWIHRSDWVRAILFLMDNPSTGAFNFTAPHPVTNTEFTRILAKQLNRPAVCHVPGWCLKWMLGELSTLILGSQRVIPQRLLESGFTFQFNQLENALNQVLKPAS